MTFPSSNLRLFATALLIAGGSLFGAETAVPAAAKSAPATAAKAKAQANAPSRAELQKKANDQRDAMIAEHEVLLKQLKDATEAQRKLILEKMQAEKKKFEEVISALHKQMRDEIRQQRQNPGPVPGKR